MDDIFTVLPPPVELSSIDIPLPSSKAQIVEELSKRETLGGLALSFVARVEVIPVK